MNLWVIGLQWRVSLFILPQDMPRRWAEGRRKCVDTRSQVEDSRSDCRDHPGHTPPSSSHPAVSSAREAPYTSLYPLEPKTILFSKSVDPAVVDQEEVQRQVSKICLLCQRLTIWSFIAKVDKNFTDIVEDNLHLAA